MEDQAFFYDWLVVDVVFHEPRVFDPLNVQICDPARPTTVVSGGPGRRRWEFMALPGESVEFLNEEATAWRLLERFDARPEQRTSREARRVPLPGPLGRGVAPGPRAARGRRCPPDAAVRRAGPVLGAAYAANLAWKLDLVLRDLAPDALLDAYGLERGPNMRAVIELAIDMGKLICVADPDEAAARDAAFIAADDGGLTDIPPFPPMAEGVILAGSPCAGELFIQAEVEVDGRRVRFDDAVGAGWRLVTLAEPALDPDLAEWFATIGGAVVSFGCGTGRPRRRRDLQRVVRGSGRRGGAAATGLLPLRHGDAGGDEPDLVRSLRAALDTPENRFSGGTLRHGL